ncbi:sialate O-acetylesterase [Streptohalobacillus salinus]|uniref:Sialate O-acetylesterase n=1 Tax=Streptohalobacillus salinus TaxID=621096 RepID=A0A2V3W9F5_9BACI|nr:sialate O-acetylesterase [Streptohalobacillus salinus]PXW91007.1 sialate O-acetylesterase [Streptohalobacillus salinus]
MMQLSKIIGNGMVIKHDAPFELQGVTEPLLPVIVTTEMKSYEVTADEWGDFAVTLDPFPVGGPYRLTIVGDETVEIEDILSGEVFLLGGQSNMELPLNRTLDLFKDLLIDVNEPSIRQFQMPQVFDFNEPRTMLEEGCWEKAVSSAHYQFSAIGYFFAQERYQETGIPIGLIQAAVGGTPIEAWLSEGKLRALELPIEALEKSKDQAYLAALTTANNTRETEWYHALNATDLGLIEHWYTQTDALFASARPFHVPQSFSETPLDNFFGAVWFIKTFEVSAETINHVFLKLGTLIDADEVFLNGVSIGKTDYKYPPRRYPVPKELLKTGENQLVIRLIVNQSTGGFVEDMPYHFEVNHDIIDLTGTWYYKVGTKTEALLPPTFVRNFPVGLYNAMIAPLSSYPIDAVLFYQGESNTDEPIGYHKKFRAMVEDFRDLWQEGSLPFFYVQLANLRTGNDTVESYWSLLRDEQRQALEMPHVYMTTTIDVGEANDLHPQDKRTVALRLLQAFRFHKGQSLTPMGPLINRVVEQSNQLTLSFDYVDRALRVNGEQLCGFELNVDGEWLPTQAETKGALVCIMKPKTGRVNAVRYAWKDNPSEANLYNHAGLPASPFQINVNQL